MHCFFFFFFCHVATLICIFHVLFLFDSKMKAVFQSPPFFFNSPPAPFPSLSSLLSYYSGDDTRRLHATTLRPWRKFTLAGKPDSKTQTVACTLQALRLICNLITSMNYKPVSLQLANTTWLFLLIGKIHHPS